MPLIRTLAALAALLAATLGTAAEVQTPYGPSSIEMELHQVPDAPVYYVIGRSGVPGADNEGFTSNAGFVVTEQGVVVYDALGTPVLGFRLLEAIRSVTDKPVKIVVAGHYHADHIYGLQAFREHTDAAVWAQRRAYEYINAPNARARLQQRREALFPWIDDSTYVVEPDQTYENEQVFDMGDTLVELVHAGPAHAPDDTLMIVHRYGVIFSGDLIFGGRLPFLGGEAVNTKRWLEELTELQSLDPAPRFVIPGHGEADADAQRAIAFTHDYIRYLRDEMGKAVDELITFDEAYRRTDWSRYEDVPTFEAANRGNAYQVYLEMEAEAF
jgi:glyoxylase-like metal-dependent hydrolase (beta-lactamase superfamily II)